ncbi:MAG: hypothetical protein IIX48_06130 [Lachnospiraceae bacterium]|nr:hypothetical protein [Lachnospiraceae bacterium]
MSTTGWIILIVTILVLVAIIVGIVFLYKKAKKNQEAQEVAMEANKQTISMLIIDKKRLKLKDSGLPPMVISQTPKLMRSAKLPIVKAKVGPQVTNFVADEKIFDSIPVKKEVKAVVSGIYITEVRGYRKNSKNAEPEKKKGFWKSTWEKAKEKAGVSQVK